MKVKRLIKAGQSLDTKSRSGRPRSVRTMANIKKARNVINKNPKTTISKVSRTLGISRQTGQGIIKKDLSSKSLKIRDVPSVGKSAGRRLKRTKALKNWIKNSANSKKVRIFSDEKLFVMDAVVNKQNDRYISDLPVSLVSPEIKFNSVSKNPAKIMVLGIVASDGKKCPMIFIPENEKVNAVVYQNLLKGISCLG